MMLIEVLFVVFLIIVASCYIAVINGKKVLVIGGTGRVGGTVARKLIANGIDTVVLARNKDSALSDPRLHGATIIQGDVTSMDDLLKATAGCSAVLDMHGLKPVRLPKITDLFVHPRHDPKHPYNVNYIAVKKILAAMQINKVDKLVRLTGAIVDTNVFTPFAVLFNLLLSKSVKWHEYSERAIRESAIDYTVLRPPGIRDELSIAKDGEPLSLVLVPGDSGEYFKRKSQISVDILAELAVKASVDKRLSRSTVLCSVTKGDGPKNWEAIISSKVNRFPVLAIFLFIIIISGQLARFQSASKAYAQFSFAGIRTSVFIPSRSRYKGHFLSI